MFFLSCNSGVLKLYAKTEAAELADAFISDYWPQEDSPDNYILAIDLHEFDYDTFVHSGSPN